MTTWRNWWVAAVCAAAIVSCSSPAPAPGPQPPGATAGAPAEKDATPDPAEIEHKARLAYLAKRLDEAREEGHAPGMAVAVVKSGEVVFAEGFGYADLDAKREVVPETVFAVGSTTKAFTAAIVGTLVAEGKMGWDDPLSKHLGVKLQTKGDREATVRDALCHRTGFPRMTLLWYGDVLSRDEILAHAAKAEPTAAIGEKFQYNNVMYMAAGEAAARAAGASWEALVQERLLDPLGMKATTLRVDDARKRGYLAEGYRWDEDLGEYEHETMRDIPSVAPAGSINSNVLDMAKWVTLQLAKGRYDGEQIVPAEALTATWEKQIDVGGGDGARGYGLGWFDRTWNDKRYIEHGGNIDGFAAQVGFLPEEGIGYVALFNVGFTPLQGTIGPTIFDAMLTDAYKESEGGLGEDVTPLVGTYIADFPPLNGKEVEVLVKGGALAVDVPGQQVFQLKSANDDGWRVFEATDAIAVRFVRDAGGKVTALIVRQGGLELEMYRKGVPPVVEVTAAQAAPFTGTYEHEDGDTVTVLVHRGRLAIDVPGQMVYDLRPPDDDGKRYFRATRDIHARFEKNERGKVTELILHQNGEDRAFAKTAGGAKPGGTVAQVKKLRKGKQRARALAALKLVKMEGVVRMPTSGIDGKSTTWFVDAKHREVIDLGRLGEIASITTPGGAWVGTPFDEPDVLRGDRLAQAQLSHPALLHGDWSTFDQIRYLRREKQDGRQAHVVELTKDDLPPVTAWVDAKTGDLLRADTQTIEDFGNIPVSTTFADYTRVGRARLPKTITVSNPFTGKIVFEVETIRPRVGGQDEAALFPEAPPKGSP